MVFRVCMVNINVDNAFVLVGIQLNFSYFSPSHLFFHFQEGQLGKMVLDTFSFPKWTGHAFVFQIVVV